MGQFYRIFVIFTVPLTVRSNIMWHEPPPFESVTDESSFSRTNKQVIQGSLNEELSCNFSLTSDLTIISVSMKFRGQPAVTLVPNQSPWVEPVFAKHFNAVWVPNKLTLTLFNVTDAEKGQYCCEVITTGRSARTWIRKIQLLVLDRNQTTVSAITASEDPRQTMASSISGLIRTTESSFTASEGDVPWGIIGAVVGVAIANTIAIVMVCFLKRRKHVEKVHHVDLGGMNRLICKFKLRTTSTSCRCT